MGDDKVAGYAVMIGNFSDGFTAYGPFANAVEAFDFYAERKRMRSSATIISLRLPELIWKERWAEDKV